MLATGFEELPVGFRDAADAARQLHQNPYSGNVVVFSSDQLQDQEGIVDDRVGLLDRKISYDLGESFFVFVFVVLLGQRIGRGVGVYGLASQRESTLGAYDRGVDGCDAFFASRALIAEGNVRHWISLTNVTATR